MTAIAILVTEASRYSALASELKASFAEIDDETLADTLDGISDLPDLLKGIMRSALVDEAFAEGLRVRLGEMKERLDRLLLRSLRKREAILSAMVRADVLKLMAEDLGMTVRKGPPRLEVRDETKVPGSYLVPQPPKLDRAGLLIALKAGKIIEGVYLAEGHLHLQVRVK